ncbi:hypothetical protein RDI58_005587 [Solanum bulbocastanum]|uniref:Uncharacterized protein n=1 Tax=Solanum bulbocastanum TaxID=147425 RepID=A0AAN8U0Y8_SOLBU
MPRMVEALKNIPVKQVAAGLSFTMFLTRKGHVFTCGTNGHVQIAAGPSYALVVSDDGTLYSFGSGANFSLGHGEQHNELPDTL